VGVDGGLLIGVISGILSFIPYFGFLFGFVSSIVMSYLQFGDFFHPLYIIIGFTVIQFIESNIVTPKFVGESLGLHPTAVIFALMVGGYLLGLGGMIFSLPVAAFLKVYLKRKFA
jgi:predicted PurR-regulated permease PerM